MAVRYGVFPRGLAIVSGVVAVYLALVALISHPLGIVGSAIIMLIWGVFLRLIAFGFEPEHFKILDEPKKAERPPSPELGPDELPDWSKIAESICSPPPTEEASSRVLPSGGRNQVAQSRIIGQARQGKSSAPDAEREEDKAWAEMFRAL